MDWALGHAAVHARFAEADLASILDHHQHGALSVTGAAVSRAGEDRSLTQGTAGWATLRTPAVTAVAAVAAVAGDGNHGQELTR